MEFFRWILILAGVAMLIATFLLGRRKVESIDYRRRAVDNDDFDPSVDDDLSVPIANDHYDAADTDDLVVTTGYRDDEEFLSDDELDDVIPVKSSPFAANDADDMGIEEAPVPESRVTASLGKAKNLANAFTQARQRNTKSSPPSMAEEFEVYDTAPEVSDMEIDDHEDDGEEKLVTLHITAKDRQFNGNELKLAFERHGYQFGKMSIYHCSHEKKKVFSVANMVKPGIFELDKMSDFSTPGITLFMRLPVGLDADVAFDFLIREAQELCEELGGQLRDANRNTLTAQTIQHMLEDIQQYSFRLKNLAHA